MLERGGKQATFEGRRMKTNRIIVGMLLLAAAVLAGGVLYYGGGEKVESEAEEPVADAGAGQSATDSIEEGFVGAARASVKKSDAGAGKGVAEVKLLPEDGSRAREDYLNAMFRPLAASGVEVAMAQVRGLPDEASKDMAMLALLGEWTGMSVTELAQRGGIGRFGVAGALALHLMGEGKLTPQETAAMANEFLSDGQRVGVLGRAAEKLAVTDPTTALAMGEGLEDWEQMRFLSRFVSGWASAAPDAAQAWVAQVEDTRTRSRLMERVLAEQAKVNPAGAAQTFSQSPPEDERMRMRTAQQIAAGWAGQDTLAALQWADSLGNESDRNAARQGIRSVAPVGIGARLSPGEDGWPVLQDLVPGSPASRSGQLRSGDRVLAVAGSSGTWVDSRGAEMRDVVGLIQGEPNTQVSLRVQGADGSEARVVTLGREQIIYRAGN